jgi:hypothetical protein
VLMMKGIVGLWVRGQGQWSGGGGGGALISFFFSPPQTWTWTWTGMAVIPTRITRHLRRLCSRHLVLMVRTGRRVEAEMEEVWEVLGVE